MKLKTLTLTLILLLITAPAVTQDVPEDSQSSEGNFFFDVNAQSNVLSQAGSIEGTRTIAPGHARLYESTITNEDKQFFTPEGVRMGVYLFRSAGEQEGFAPGTFDRIWGNNLRIAWDGTGPGVQPIRDSVATGKGLGGAMHSVWKTWAERTGAFREYDAYLSDYEEGQEPKSVCKQKEVGQSDCWPVQSAPTELADAFSQATGGDGVDMWSGYLQVPVKPMSPKTCSAYEEGSTSYEACKQLPSERTKKFWIAATENADATPPANFGYCNQRTIYSALSSGLNTRAPKYLEKCPGDLDMLVTLERPEEELFGIFRDPNVMKAAQLKVRVVDPQVGLLIQALRIAFLGAAAVVGYAANGRGGA